eukprot:SAG11_NODE_70_length_18450_cov_14.704975_2_plen_91_part_00
MSLLVLACTVYYAVLPYLRLQALSTVSFIYLGYVNSRQFIMPVLPPASASSNPATFYYRKTFRILRFLLKILYIFLISLAVSMTVSKTFF